MSLPELCLTRNMLPKRLLGRRLPPLKNEGILVKRQKPGVGVGKSGLYSEALSPWGALFLELWIQNVVSLVSPLMIPDYRGHQARQRPEGFSHRQMDFLSESPEPSGASECQLSVARSGDCFFRSWKPAMEM